MRHFREDLRARGLPVHYLTLESHAYPSLAAALSALLEDRRPRQVIMQRAGDWRVQQSLVDTVARAGLVLQVVESSRFLITPDDFRAWLGDRKQPRMEWIDTAKRINNGLRWRFSTDDGA